MGALLHKMGKKYASASTTQNTTTQEHTTINMSRCGPTLPLPYTIRRRRAVGLALAVVGLLAWGGEMRGIKNRERGGFLALGGRRIKCLNNNQMGDGDDVRGCVGEEARLGRNVLGGRLPVVWGLN